MRFWIISVKFTADIDRNSDFYGCRFASQNDQLGSGFLPLSLETCL